MYRNQPVAVKTIKFRMPSDHVDFLKEVNAMNKLHHPNIGMQHVSPLNLLISH